MKRLLNILIFLISTAFCFAQADSDVQLYNDIKQSFYNGFYPGTVSSADQLQKSFPDSSLIHSALTYKGQALIYMENYEEALETLESALSHMHSGSAEIIKCNYLMGRAFYSQKKYKQALEKFHLACNLALTKKEMEYYPSSILYSGRAFYELEEWDKAYPLFEYVASNGRDFDSNDYGEAMQKLFISYNKSGSPEKTVMLFNKLTEVSFESAVYLSLCFYYGDACAALNMNKEAYEAYARVLENDGKHPEKVNTFLLRLAADEFNAENYENAESYLEKINISDGNENSELRLAKSIYEAKILLEKKQPKEAEKKLAGLDSAAKKAKTEGLADSYYSSLLQCKIQNEKWEEIPSVYAKLNLPHDEDRLILSLYYYKKGQYDKVDSGSGELYASALCKLGRYEAACSEYGRLGISSYDYALALFRTGHYDESIKIADESGADEKDYLAGLCHINRKEWNKASQRFALYIKQASSRNDFKKLSLYYKGYAEYNQADFRDSYSSFVRYCMEEQTKTSQDRAYLMRAYEYAVKSALQSGDFKNASIQAANLVRFSSEGKEKQKALVLSAEILTDYKNYSAALELLSPYTSGRDEFAAEALFMTAKIYELDGKLSMADENYRRIYDGMSRSSYAEEAMYRAGELYYSQGDFAQAYTRFNNYVYKYASGRFSDAALFYCADCALHLGDNDRCVMLNKTLLQKWPASVYAYGANKNLLEAYYSQEEYSQALELARGMLRDFPQQAGDDEIAKRVRELEKIVGGVDRRVVEKESEYVRLGEAGTLAGRNAGTELVRLYAESLSTQTEAYELAEKLFARQSAYGERANAAYNAEFIAEYNRKNGNNRKAAEMYLKAAEYYRNVKNEGGAASALYGAAEAFSADGLSGDARETAALLKELYPQSIQAERVDRVTGAERN